MCAPHVIGIHRARYAKFCSFGEAESFLVDHGIPADGLNIRVSDYTPVGEMVESEEVYAVVYPKTKREEILPNWEECRAAINGKVAIHQKCRGVVVAKQFIEQVKDELKRIESKTRSSHSAQDAKLYPSISPGGSQIYPSIPPGGNQLYPLITLGENPLYPTNEQDTNELYGPGGANPQKDEVRQTERCKDVENQDCKPKTEAIGNDASGQDVEAWGRIKQLEKDLRTSTKQNKEPEIETKSSGEPRQEQNILGNMDELEQSVQACLKKKQELLIEIRNAMVLAKKFHHPARLKGYWKFVL